MLKAHTPPVSPDHAILLARRLEWAIERNARLAVLAKKQAAELHRYGGSQHIAAASWHRCPHRDCQKAVTIIDLNSDTRLP